MPHDPRAHQWSRTVTTACRPWSWSGHRRLGPSQADNRAHPPARLDGGSLAATGTLLARRPMVVRNHRPVLTATPTATTTQHRRRPTTVTDLSAWSGRRSRTAVDPRRLQSGVWCQDIGNGGVTRHRKQRGVHPPFAAGRLDAPGMSRARLVITAVVVEGRGVREVAHDYGVSPGWVSRLVARYRDEGGATFEPRSRRPHRSPRATPAETVELIIDLRRRLVRGRRRRRCGNDRLASRPPPRRVAVGHETIGRYLHRAGLVTPQPHKRPRSSYVRFQAEQPNETWQADFTHYRLATGADVEVLCWLDDHARYALRLTAHPARHRNNRAQRVPRCHSPPRRPHVDADRQRHGVHHPPVRRQGRPQRLRSRASPPRHRPEELSAQPSDHLRESRAVPPDPQALATRPTQPARDQQRAASTARRLRRPLQPRTTSPIPARAMHPHGRVPPATPKRPPATAATTATTASALCHRQPRKDHPSASTAACTTSASAPTHHGTRVVVLAHDIEVRVVHATTGELIRQLTIDPTKDYQPLGIPPGPKPRQPPR